MRLYQPPPTYTCFFQDDHSEIVYRSRRDPVVPEGAVPSDDPRSTYFGPGDRFAFAWFVKDGRTIIVQCDGVPPASS